MTAANVKRNAPSAPPQNRPSRVVEHSTPLHNVRDNGRNTTVVPRVPITPTPPPKRS
jgi:hypothetical protein